MIPRPSSIRIEKPAASEFVEPAGMANFREAQELAGDVVRPIRKAGRDVTRGALWSYAIPFAMGAAHYVLAGRWPEIFQTFWAYLMLVAAFGWYAWKHLGTPVIAQRLRDRRECTHDLDQAFDMREALEAQWRRGKAPR